MVKAALLGLLLGLHFFTRLHGQQVTPLQERHFYPFSYFVSLSLLEGRGFGYLLPAHASVEEVWRGSTAPPGDPASPVLGFVRLTGQEDLSRQQLADYLASGARVVEADPVESTRVLDIQVAALLWRVFGVDWSVYFLFYALLSTATCFALFYIVREATGSYAAGLAAAFGLLASPLEQYSSVWSTRDTVPLWFTALAFGALAAFSRIARNTRGTVVGAFGVGAASLIGLGWRPDFQVVPPLVLAGLVAILVSQRRPRLQLAQAIAAFALGCAAVLLLLRVLGPGAYSQGGIGFHIAWYGETTRSNLLQTENAFQVARDDQLTLYQANYFGRARFGASPEGAPSSDTKDPLHHGRCRAMYLELARYQAFSWWASFPAFLARGARIDRPTLLASEEALAAFLDRRPGWMQPLYERCLDRYGSLLPWLMLAGLVGGILDDRSRVTTALMAAYFVGYALVVLLVLPETKHMIPLLLPVHVIAAIGLWSAARALVSWRRLPRLAWASRRRLAAVALAAAVVVLAWGVLGASAYGVSRRQRARIVDDIRRSTEAASEPTETSGKLFSSHLEAGSATSPFGYLLRVRASRPANLLCLHVRGTSADDGFLAYYTRHPIEPGADRLFFFNVVGGRDLGDPRPYTAHVRLVGPAHIVSGRKVDLSRWPLGLPLSVLLDENDQRPGGTLVGPGGAATEVLPVPSEVGHLLEEPGAFLVSYRPE